MKILNGLELSGFIKERQAGEVRALRQAHNIFPRLAIICTGNNLVIDSYINRKKEYGDDILIDVDVIRPKDDELLGEIKKCNEDDKIHGIIVQLPLNIESQTESAIASTNPSKDVDGLGCDPIFTPATAMAIDWLLAGYGIDLNNKKIAIVGNGRLVGKPLSKLWQSAGYNLSVYDNTAEDLASSLQDAEVIITATGAPGLITSEMVMNKAVIVDAGTTSEKGVIVGDVADDVRLRDDITITPIKGGVGPMTVAALFDNVIRAAKKTIK